MIPASLLRIRICIAIFLLIMACGALAFMYVEHLSFADALYFSIVTVTTVGYGDIHPTTDAGKIIASMLILTGVGTFTLLLTNTTETLLNAREKRERLQRLNMVIGSFFSELGTQLLFSISSLDVHIDTIRGRLENCGKWQEKDFDGVRKHMLKYPFEAQYTPEDLVALRDLLHSKSHFMMRILENPNLSEHEHFTDLMWALFHLKDELLNRHDVSALPTSDQQHLAGDIKRVYTLLLSQWIDYMQHLKQDYPYLFSLAVRTNPFDKDACAIVK